MQAMIATAAQLSKEELMAQAQKFAQSTEAFACDVVGALLGALMEKMPENEFVAFCDSL